MLLQHQDLSQHQVGAVEGHKYSEQLCIERVSEREREITEERGIMQHERERGVKGRDHYGSVEREQQEQSDLHMQSCAWWEWSLEENYCSVDCQPDGPAPFLCSLPLTDPRPSMLPLYRPETQWLHSGRRKKFYQLVVLNISFEICCMLNTLPTVLCRQGSLLV